MRVYDHHLYLLAYQTSGLWSIRKYILNGDFVLSWEHDDYKLRVNQFVINDDTLYVPSISTNSIKQYTTLGESIDSHIPVVLNNSVTCVCLTPGRHLVMFQDYPSLVMCVDVDPQNRCLLWN